MNYLNSTIYIVNYYQTMFCCIDQCAFMRIFGKMLSAFIYGSCIIFPWITEIILGVKLSQEHRYIMLVVCGSIQTCLSAYLGFGAGVFSEKTKCDACNYRNKDLCNESFCLCPIYCRSLYSIGFITYFLPQWILANMIINWSIVDNQMPLYVHLVTYMPLVIFFPAFFLGFAYIISMKSEGLDMDCKIIENTETSILIKTQQNPNNDRIPKPE